MKKPTPKEVLEARRRSIKIWAVGAGVWVAVYFGVLSQAALKRIDFATLSIDLDVTGWGWGSYAVAAIGATLICRRMVSRGELKGKLKNVGRIVGHGYAAGFTLMGLSDLISGIGG